MASKKRGRKPTVTASESALYPAWVGEPRTAAIGFVLAVLLFYFQPLFDAAYSIQWDAVDVQYSAQKYLAEMLHAGKLPFWTPYVFSGMPFLADPQVGAWYPLNWPFFLIGITPRAIEGQLALHALVAAMGAWLLARDILRSRAAAVIAGIFFGFSGLFAETSSHVGPFQATSLLPWVLFTGRKAAHSVRWLPGVAIASGLIVLTGHFQTALYSFFALVLFLAADCVISRGSPARAALALTAAAIGAITLSAVMMLPGLELSGESIRAGLDYSRDAGAVLVPGALLTLVSPDHYGALGVEHYTGPQDITQFYLYMGLLLVPLALIGLTRARARWYALALVVPGIWYAFGPGGGLYSVVTMLPGFRSVRAPIQMWFVAALGLTLLAGAGVDAVRARIPSPWVAVALLAFTGADLYYWNMASNRLTYARAPFQDLYGDAQERFRSILGRFTAAPIHRIWSAVDSPAFGPLNGTLDSRIEATFGYNPLQLARYKKYVDAAEKNPFLLNGLGVTAAIDAAKGSVRGYAGLPRIYAPATVTAARDQQEAEVRLLGLEPAREGIVEGAGAIPNNGGVDVRITGYEGDTYRAHYTSDHAALLRVAAPYFPGWQGEVDGRAVQIAPVDVALIGVLVPAGSHDLVVRYRSRRFATGLAISIAAWLAALGGVAWAVKARRVRPPETPTPG